MNKLKIILITAAVLLGAAAWWVWSRPSALEKARTAMDKGDPATAVEILLKHMNKEPLERAEALDVHRELSRAYLMKGSYDNAEQTLRPLLEMKPEDPFGNLALGFLFFSRGQDMFAVDYLQKAKALAPNDLRPSKALMSLFNFRGDFDQARAEALDILNRAPEDIDGRMGLGRADLGRGLFLDAAQTFESVLAATPHNDARRLLVRSLLESGEALQAEKALAPLLKNDPDDPGAMLLQSRFFLLRSHPDQAIGLLRRIFSKNPRRLFAAVTLGRELARRRDIDAAQGLLLDVAQRLPKLEEAPLPPYSSFYQPWEALEIRNAIRRLRAGFHLAMADVYLSRYLFPDAERQIRLALQLDPREVDTLKAMTNLRRLGGDPQEHLRAARNAADQLPSHPQILLDLAQALLTVKQPQEALTYAQAAATTCPSLSRAHTILAEIRLALNEVTVAQAAAEAAVERNDRDPSAWTASGLVKAAKGDLHGAEEAFKKALELNGFLARAHWELAKVLKKGKKNRASNNHRERAIELEPRVYASR